MYIVIVYRPKFQSKSWAQYANKVFGEIWGYTFFEKKKKINKTPKSIPHYSRRNYYVILQRTLLGVLYFMF